MSIIIQNNKVIYHNQFLCPDFIVIKFKNNSDYHRSLVFMIVRATEQES